MEERVEVGCPNLLIGGARLSSMQNLPGHRRSIRLPILLLIKLLLKCNNSVSRKQFVVRFVVNDEHVL